MAHECSCGSGDHDQGAEVQGAGHGRESRWELGEDTLARRRRVLGEDHPGILVIASSLAIDLRALGET